VIGSERTDKPVVGGALFSLLSHPTDTDGVSKPHNFTQAMFQHRTVPVFARVICALFCSIFTAEKSGCVKYADFFFFFVEVLIWVLF